MKKSFFQKLLAFFLACLMMFGTLAAVPVLAADEDDALTAGTSSDDLDIAYASDTDGSGKDGAYGSFASVDEVKKFLNLLSYVEYNKKYADVPKAEKDIVIQAVDYDPEQTTAEVEIKSDFEGMSGDSLYMGSTGTTSWKVNIPADGRYAMRITYYSVEGTYTTIERKLTIDGLIPFSEARYLYFPRVWEYIINQEDGSFDTDRNGNDIRPIRQEAPEWQTYYLRDWLGYTMEPFEFYLTKGEHTITFEAARENIVISTIELYRYDSEPTYEEFLADMKSRGITAVTGVEPVKVQAENPVTVSNANLYPINDRTSALTEPQDPSCMRYNILNSSVVNQWMRYSVTVEKEGLYSIVVRFRQNDLIGMFTSRRVYINGEIQFKEASNCRFKYSPDWQAKPLNNGETEFLFYLKEGENTITFECVLGDMTEYVYRIEQMIDNLNEAYQKFVMLTGPTPDAYRDYGFTRIVPEAVAALAVSARELYAIADELEEITGELGDQVATLNTIGTLFETMAKDEYKIAPNFVTFKNYIIALSNWLYASLAQPMKMDYFVVQSAEEKLPQAKANFFQAAWFEIKAFVMSFFMDYTTIGFKSDVVYDESKTVEMWITSALGRDAALISRNIIDTYFTPESGISVTIKVITAGLTEAILAGIGPDVASMSTTDTVTWGLRNAVEPLNDMPGYEEVMTWFHKAATTPLTLYGVTYGIPQTMAFNMLFYRADVLAELNLEIPKTWDDLYDILPVLQNKHLEIGLPISLAGTNIFLYQMGSELFRNDGREINLDTNTSLDAFESLCDMFTKYKCPVAYDITRFRTGQMPIIVADAITTYNTLMTFYELRGMWDIAPLLGVKQEDGSINHTSVATITALVIPRGAANPEATWEYIKWTVSADTQLRLAREDLYVSANPTYKSPTANIEALKSLAWTDYEREALETQLDSLVGIPEYPGIYIVSVYVSNAFMAVYNSNSDPSTEMLDRILDINKEISRKRKEFKMDYIDINTGELVQAESD